MKSNETPRFCICLLQDIVLLSQYCNSAILKYCNIAFIIVRYSLSDHNNEIVQYCIYLLQDIVLLIAETKSRNLLGSINKREPWWLWFIEHHHHLISIINNIIVIIKREHNGCGSKNIIQKFPRKGFLSAFPLSGEENPNIQISCVWSNIQKILRRLRERSHAWRIEIPLNQFRVSFIAELRWGSREKSPNWDFSTKVQGNFEKINKYLILGFFKCLINWTNGQNWNLILFTVHWYICTRDWSQITLI